MHRYRTSALHVEAISCCRSIFKLQGTPQRESDIYYNALPPSTADSSHPWVAAPMAQSITNCHRARGCLHWLVASWSKISFSSSVSDKPSSRVPSKALSFWAMNAPFSKNRVKVSRLVSAMNLETSLLTSASSSRSKGACIRALMSGLKFKVGRRV